MKIIIPMAGIGSRLKPHTLTTPKPLTILAGKPIVQRLVEDIAKIVGDNISDIGFIIGPTEKGFSTSVPNDLKQIAKTLGAVGHIFVQNEALGTAHAIHQAKTLLDGPVVVAFADTLFRADFTLNNRYDGVIWVKQVDNPESFGVVKLDNNIITDFVEKPATFVSDLAIIGVYYFKNGEKLKAEIDYLIDNDIKGKGDEYQLTDALENMKLKGMQFTPGKVTGWMDNGNKTVTVETNHKILDYAKSDGENLTSENIKLENAKIIQPCYIGEDVIISNSTVGPHVSLGANSTVIDSNISNSLIQSNCTIKNAQLKDSMLGHHVKYNGKFASVSLGDFSELE